MPRGELLTAAWAGNEAGAIWGVPLVLYVLLRIDWPSFTQRELSALSHSFPQDVAWFFFYVVVVAMVVLIVFLASPLGAFLGVVYFWLYDGLPGGSSLRKGVVFGVLCWVVVAVWDLVTSIQGGLTPFEVVGDVALALGFALVFCVLLAIFYDRSAAQEES